MPTETPLSAPPPPKLFVSPHISSSNKAVNMAQPRSRISPLLEPYIQLPAPGSLHLITGTLSATPHWLTTHYLASLLGSSPEHGRPPAIVLASWMRDENFWIAEGRRGAGLDLRRLEAEDRWRYVDGVSGIFLPAETQSTQQRTGPSDRAYLAPMRTPSTGVSMPVRGPVPTPRALPGSTDRDPINGRPSASAALSNPSLDTAFDAISTALTAVSKASPAILVLDSPTLLLATASTAPAQLQQFIMRLRALAHATLVVVEADMPLLSAAVLDAARSHTPLEEGHATFVAGLGHGARWMLGARPLETGVAKDVGGVLSVRRGGAWDDAQDPEGARSDDEGRDMEVLYRVGVDGRVSVFERGTGEAG